MSDEVAVKAGSPIGSAAAPADQAPAQSPGEDVEMTDAQEEQMDEEQIRHSKRAAMLKQVLASENTHDPYEKSYCWARLTPELVEAYTTNQEVDLDELEMYLGSSTSGAYVLFYEVFLCIKYFPGRIPYRSLVDLVTHLLSDYLLDKHKIAFITTLNMFEIDTSLISFIKDIKVLPQLDLGMHLMNDAYVTKLNLITDFDKKALNLRKISLEQKKYNLIHECSEGYAKLTVLLHDTSRSEISHFQVNYAVKATERIIGHFNLDPLRSLQLILTVAASHTNLNYKFFVDYLKATPWWPKGREANPYSLESLNEGGNADAAQVLAFQLQSYKSPDAKLSNLITLLLKEGFISFGSLFQYLEPTDEEMKNFEENVKNRIDEEIMKASANLLALSAPLEDEEDDSANTGGEESQKEVTEEVPTHNVKLVIFEQLLADGLYYPALFLLGKYPKLAFGNDDIPTIALRLFNQMVQPLRDELRPLTQEQFARLSVSRPGTRDQFQRKYFSENPTVLKNKSLARNYFYKDWKEGIPTIKTVDDLIKYSNEFLSFFGAKIGEDSLLLSLLSRVALRDLEAAVNTSQYEGKMSMWFDYARKFILPASTFILENPIAAHDMFSLFKHFPFQWRLNMYGEFRDVTSKSNAFVKLNYGKAEKSTKDILKRLTKENVKSTMRRLSKITFANPLPSFNVIITQVESYDNLTNLVVEAARYFTDYAWDVLLFVLITRLTLRRDAIQSDGINDALWLHSLSTFISKLAKSYPAFDLQPIITYSLKALHDGNTVGLSIIRTLINNMGGIQKFTNLSPTQIKFLNSGESLQRITRKVIMDTRDDSRRSGERLLGTLAKSDVVSELFVLLSHYSTNILSKSNPDDHFKVITDRFDECASILHTYCELVKFFESGVPDLFEKHVVPLYDLIGKHGVSVPWSFELWREHIPTTSQTLLDISTVSFDNLAKELYYCFWRMGLYDIRYEESEYDLQLEHLRSENRTIVERIRITKVGRAETEDIRRQDERMRTELLKKKKFNEEILKSLEADKAVHQKHHQSCIEAISESRSQWFASETPSAEEIETFVECCVIPRVLHSGSDAMFTSAFITSVISGDESLRVIDHILSTGILTSLMFTLTAYEAENLGLFVGDLFEFYNRPETTSDEKRAALRWMTQILNSITDNTIDTEEYLSRRNTYTFLKNLIPTIKIDYIGESIRDVVEDTAASETREDLRLASNAILGLLQSASKNWKKSWEYLEADGDEKAELSKLWEVVLRRRMLKKQEEKRIEREKAETEERIRREERERRAADSAKLEAARREKERAEAAIKREKETAERAERDAKEAELKLATGAEDSEADDVDMAESDSGSPLMIESQYVAGDEETDMVSEAPTSDILGTDDLKTARSSSVSPVPSVSDALSVSVKDVKEVEAEAVTTSGDNIDNGIVHKGPLDSKMDGSVSLKIEESRPATTQPVAPPPKSAAARSLGGRRPSNELPDFHSHLNQKAKTLLRLVRESDVPGLVDAVKDQEKIAKMIRDEPHRKATVRIALTNYYKAANKDHPNCFTNATKFEGDVSRALNDYKSRFAMRRDGRMPSRPSATARSPLPAQESIFSRDTLPASLPSGPQSSRGPIDSRDSRVPREFTTGHYRQPSSASPVNSRVPSQRSVPVTAPPPPPSVSVRSVPLTAPPPPSTPAPSQLPTAPSGGSSLPQKREFARSSGRPPKRSYR